MTKGVGHASLATLTPTIRILYLAFEGVTTTSIGMQTLGASPSTLSVTSKKDKK
jgi:hypothetical protein